MSTYETPDIGLPTILIVGDFSRRDVPDFVVNIEVKWSGKSGQRAKVYPTRTNGYGNDKATELFRQV